MFDNAPTIIGFIFRIINFAALVLLFIYVYKRYIRLNIEQTIENEEKAEQALIQTRGDLKSRRGIIAEQIVRQEELGRSLSGKIALWRSCCGTKEQEQQKHMLEIRKHMLKRMQTQSHTIEITSLYKAVKQPSLVDAQRELEKQFTNPETGKKYLHDIIIHLEKEAS